MAWWWCETTELCKELVPVTLFPAKIAHGQTWDLTWASAVTDHLLNTITIALSCCVSICYFIKSSYVTSSSYLISLINFHKSIFSYRVTVFVRMPRKMKKKQIFFRWCFNITLHINKPCDSLCSKMVCYALNMQGSKLRQDTVKSEYFWSPPSLLSITTAVFQDIKWPQSEEDNLYPSSTQIKNLCNSWYV